jgi:hypothetical protein
VILVHDIHICIEGYIFCNPRKHLVTAREIFRQHKMSDNHATHCQTIGYYQITNLTRYIVPWQELSGQEK